MKKIKNNWNDNIHNSVVIYYEITTLWIMKQA